METFEQQYLKMSIIGTIQLMENQIGMLDPYSFADLFRMNYDQLTEIRDTRIKQYNAFIENVEFIKDIVFKK